MNLIKTSILNGVAVTIKMLTYFVINKVLAVLVGPTGFVAIGQFQNAMQMITTFASGAINTGVTKYTAENFNDELEQVKLWKTAGKIVLLCSFFTSILIAFFCKKLSILFFDNEDFYYVFLSLSGTLVFFNLNVLLLAILTGKKELKTYVLANISGSIFALFVISLMAYFWRLEGALVALTIYQSISFFITLFLCLNTKWFKISYLFGVIDKKVFWNLSKYTLMALTSALVVPTSQILVRDLVKHKFSVDVAGYWEGMNRLSNACLMMATTTLSVYFLPRLSEITEKDKLKKELLDGIKLLFPLSFVILSCIYLNRDFVVRMLFSDNFYPMRDLFFWQLLGDLVKISSWVFGYVLIAKAYFKVFIISEIIFSFSLYFLFLLTSYFQDISLLTLGYFVNYCFYFIFLIILLLRKKIL